MTRNDPDGPDPNKRFKTKPEIVELLHCCCRRPTAALPPKPPLSDFESTESCSVERHFLSQDSQLNYRGKLRAPHHHTPRLIHQVLPLSRCDFSSQLRPSHHPH